MSASSDRDALSKLLASNKRRTSRTLLQSSMNYTIAPALTKSAIAHLWGIAIAFDHSLTIATALTTPPVTLGSQQIGFIRSGAATCYAAGEAVEEV
jgi:hypothetical protein